MRLKVLHGLGYSTGEETVDPLQNVRLVWCEHPEMPAVELVSPEASPGPLDSYLSDTDELIYHLCYATADLKHSIDAVKADGIRVLTVSEPKPAVLFDGKPVSFYLFRGFGLVEIVEDM